MPSIPSNTYKLVGCHVLLTIIKLMGIGIFLGVIALVQWYGEIVISIRCFRFWHLTFRFKTMRRWARGNKLTIRWIMPFRKRQTAEQALVKSKSARRTTQSLQADSRHHARTCATQHDKHYTNLCAIFQFQMDEWCFSAVRAPRSGSSHLKCQKPLYQCDVWKRKFLGWPVPPEP